MLARPASILQEYGPMMRDLEAWQYDEFRQMARDYGNPAEVEIYDSIHAGFRDVEAESNQVLDLLVLTSSDVLIEFGSGTGTFALAAARRCARVHAVDVSPAMIEYAKTKAIRADQPAAAIATTFALHHLPDLWKGIALARMRSILRPGGQLYIHDVILEQDNAMENIKALVDKQSVAGGDFLKNDAEGHFQQEHSTYDWILDGLLSRAGFKIVTKTIQKGVIGKYHVLGIRTLSLNSSDISESSKFRANS
jgi:putative AdoMet-dependent methyltransferase